MRITPFPCDACCPEEGNGDLTVGNTRSPAIKGSQNLKQAGRRARLRKMQRMQRSMAFKLQ